MRLLCNLGALLILLVAVTACQEMKGSSSDYGFFMARLQDCKPGYIPPSDNFGPGETPAAVFGDLYTGLTITVRVYSIYSGGIVYNRTEYISRESTTNWWSLKALPGGAYKAELLTGNMLRQSYNFNIAKAAARSAVKPRVGK